MVGEGTKGLGREFSLPESCERGAGQNMKTQQGEGEGEKGGVTLSSSPEFNKLSFVPPPPSPGD